MEEVIWKVLDEIKDPEIPVISITELGIVRDVTIDNESCEITITPTYNGCPAMNMIEMQIKAALSEFGFSQLSINYTLTPAWTTDWMGEEAKNKLIEYGIAAPGPRSAGDTGQIPCPRCGSKNTKKLSEFGSTACKALYTCSDCLEPFDYFKCH